MAWICTRTVPGSAATNNGSDLEGLADNTLWWNLSASFSPLAKHISQTLKNRQEKCCITSGSDWSKTHSLDCRRSWKFRTGAKSNRYPLLSCNIHWKGIHIIAT
ncbi:potassium-transporting ATPase subunit KdpA [Thermocoleostomius sinensis A174]|uniref:Potassium-transporting ATPase subunit KdpA n=1 Tax=Thermocoleostomius sinensis A174 TaxID=2016057 RepID=A0A9E9CA78_9CYAN|nr:potassium-transporting ATPase subunit KdpA [Thermocoleostomius sinensis A174]